ncbi:hypothetical protein [Vulcanococcus limneticus]|uniref:hypothetical protein n=1 Tax=Vulcanococcus limneticus TaxID=2170428 RepID=UPI00398BFCAF
MDPDRTPYRREPRPDPRDQPRREGRREPGRFDAGRFDAGRLDQWMSAGRQLVDGVAGARPGSRPGGRPAEGRAGGRPSLEGLGRWVETRLDWLLEDDDDWREPWEPPAPRRSTLARRDQERWSEPAAPRGAEAFGAGRPAAPDPWDRPAPAAEAGGTARRAVQAADRSPASGVVAAQPMVERRPLEAISRRTPPLLSPRSGAAASAAGLASEVPASDDWPDDASFSVPRWQREPQRSGFSPGAGAATPQESRPAADPGVAPGRASGAGPGVGPGATPAATGRQAPARPLPRSTRRRQA